MVKASWGWYGSIGGHDSVHSDAVLDITEAPQADTDLNVIMTAAGGFVEIQGTAEQEAFSVEELNAMLALAQKAIVELAAAQQAALDS